MNKSERPLILVSNDDGVHAEGIAVLATALAPLGDVIVVAPESEQSATSHSITLSRPLRLRAHSPSRFSVDGTPVDAVYIALHHQNLLPRKPDLVVSGINHGPNLGSDVFYSGTVAAAREAAMRGIDALAVSLDRGGSFTHAGWFAHEIAAAMLSHKRHDSSARPPGAALLNLNVPVGDHKLLHVTRLGERLYDELVELRVDPRGRQYLWIGGPTVTHPPSEGTDTAAQDEGIASLTPLGIDLYAGQWGSWLGTVVNTLSIPSIR